MSRTFLFLLLAGFAVPDVTFAQGAAGGADGGGESATGGGGGELPAPTQVDDRRMYEDIEIMGRLMQTKLKDLYAARADVSVKYLDFYAASGMAGMEMDEGGFGGMGMGMGYISDASKSMKADQSKIELDGVYLPGHGIVFSANVPQLDALVRTPHSKSLMTASSCARCHMANPEVNAKFAEALAKQPQPISEWEKTRRAVLGIKDVDKKPRPTSIMVCDPGTLAELVLRVLAENGQHLSQLPSNESVTIAVTFRNEPPKKARSYGGGSTGMMGGSSGAIGYGGGAAMPGFGSGGGAPARKNSSGFDSGGGGAAVGGVDSGFGSGASDGFGALPGAGAGGVRPKSQRDYVLLGDLHLKQGKADSALDAYSRALSSLIDPKKISWLAWVNTPESKRRQILDLYSKMAQAALAAGRVKDAQTHLNSRASLVDWSESKSPASKASNLNLPSRLIVSARKSTLNEAANEKLSFEEFKKQSKVKHLSLNGKTTE